MNTGFVESLDQSSQAAPLEGVRARVLKNGAHLQERYIIQEFLGRGGTGQVYRATDTRTGLNVAIKIVLPDADTNRVRRFRREFRALTRLAHPHVISVHDLGEVDGLPFYVMEYIDGPNLHQLLVGRKEPLSVYETVTIGIQIGQALAYIHNRGIVHRDVKPANIMVLKDAQVESESHKLYLKLMDFGLVKMADIPAQLTASGMWVGTYQYMAPEQLKGLTVDHRADLYALGLILYEAATGAFPFSGTSVVELASQRLFIPPTHPHVFQADLPSELCRLILKLLESDLGERYTAAEEVLTDLAPLFDASIDLAPPPPPRADAIVRSPLIGRTKELQELSGQLNNAWTSAARFVLVEGEAGVGKTRLLQELTAIARQQGGQCLQGSCYEEERIAYGPFIEALEGFIAGRARRQHKALQGLEPELGRLIPSLAVTAEAPPISELQDARLRLFDAVARFFIRLSREKPVMLVLDDLQWADGASLELLHYLVRNTRKAAVHICGTTRYEELSDEHPLVTLLESMGRRGMVERHFLDRLSPEAVSELVTALLGSSAAPTQLASRLYHEAEGNPFFVEEMLKAWVEEGRLVRESEGWKLVTDESRQSISTLSIPGSIADIVGRRLRGLPNAETDLLAQAAVLGREFNFDVLLEMTELGDENIALDAIEDLLRARLLEEVHHPREDRYRFAHKKIQEVIYTRQSRRRLRHMHLKAGEAMERIYAGRLDQVTEPLARHFLEAGDPRGIEYALQAGNAARAVFANKEALGYYGQALWLADALWEQAPSSHLAEQIITLCLGLAEINLLVSEYQAAVENFEFALNMLPDAQLDAKRQRLMMASIHRRLAYAQEDQGNYQEAMAQLQKALAAFPKTGDQSRDLALIYESIAWVQRRQGQYQEAITSCHKGLELVPPQDQGAVADLDDTLGVIHRDLGEYGRSAAYHQRSLSLREQMDDQPGIAKTCNYLTLVHLRQKNYQQAVAYSHRSLEISEKIGHIAGVASLTNNLGLIYSEQGERLLAIEHHNRALEMFERIGNHLGVAQAYANLGEIYLAQRDLPMAMEYLQLALDKSSEVGYREGVTFAHQLRAEIHLMQGDPGSAISEGQQALQVATSTGARPYQARAHHLLGQSYLALEDTELSHTHLEAARRIFSDLGDRERAADVEALLSTAGDQDNPPGR